MKDKIDIMTERLNHNNHNRKYILSTIYVFTFFHLLVLYNFSQLYLRNYFVLKKSV